jgi:hypothetical protein
LDRRTETPDGSGGASPTVVTARDDDDDLIVGDGQPDELTDTAESEAAPALPADEIGVARDSSAFTFRRPVAAPVSPAADDTDGWTPAADDTDGWTPDGSAPGDEAMVSSPTASESGDAGVSGDAGLVGDAGLAGDADVSGGTGVSGGAGLAYAEASGSESKAYVSGDGSAPPAADPSPSKPSRLEPPAVSAATFVWDAPEPEPTSPLSAARNFLRSNAAAKDPAPPRTPAATIGPAKTDATPTSAPAPAPSPARTPASARAPAPTSARATGTRPKGSSKRSARQAHLIVARVEPWSVMKFSFVVSLVAFVILFVAVSVLYGTLSGLGVFTSLDHVVSSVTSSQNSAGVNASKWFTASRVLGYTALLGSINIVLITAISTIGAVIYNLTSRLIGGVEVTLRETD